MKNDKTKKQWALFITGLILLFLGLSILGFYGGRRIYREYQKHILFRDNPVLEISSANIKAPILEGTDKVTLSKAAGHFTGTGDFGKGNYCIAGHSSTIYKEYFNNLHKVRIGDKITLYDKNKKEYVYTTTEKIIVEPSETWVLNDFGDNRITIITCTDDGRQRQVIVGKYEGDH